MFVLFVGNNINIFISLVYSLASGMSENKFNLSNPPLIPVPQSEATFEEKVKAYIAIHRPKLSILTPCYGSVCFVNFVSCLMGTIQLFNDLGFPIKVEFCRNDSLVSRARNNLIAKAMNDVTTTHFMFIDNDITWNPVDILKLVISDKPLVGGVYPIKHYHWDRLSENNGKTAETWIENKRKSNFNNMCPDTDYIQSKLLRFNINNISNVLAVENNLTKVKHLATGFMLIQRNVIEKMCLAFPSTKYTDDVGFLEGEENKYAYALFDCGVEEGHYFSEDWLFCSRWSKMGGQIWVDVTINLTHTGTHDYKGSFISSLV